MHYKINIVACIGPRDDKDNLEDHCDYQQVRAVKVKLVVRDNIGRHDTEVQVGYDICNQGRQHQRMDDRFAFLLPDIIFSVYLEQEQPDHHKRKHGDRSGTVYINNIGVVGPERNEKY